MATLVKFVKDFCTNEIVAVFPQHKFNKYLYGNNVFSSYSHNGQHSPCNKDYIMGETSPAKKWEYLTLKQELESIGYDLKICK